MEFSDLCLSPGAGASVRIVVGSPADNFTGSFHQQYNKKLPNFGGAGFVVGDLLLLVESTSRGSFVVVRKRNQPGATGNRACAEPECVVHIDGGLATEKAIARCQQRCSGAGLPCSKFEYVPAPDGTGGACHIYSSDATFEGAHGTHDPGLGTWHLLGSSLVRGGTYG